MSLIISGSMISGKRKNGDVSVTYFLNHWISCAYIGGPYGWISPEGEIGGLLYGGKYGVETEELEEDLKKVATEWPSLDFTVYPC